MNLDRRYIVNLAAAKRQPMGISPPLTYRHINLAPDNVLFAPDKVNFAVALTTLLVTTWIQPLTKEILFLTKGKGA